MRSKAIFMALLALAFAAQGALVSQETAEVAASGWASRGKTLGVPVGLQVEKSAAHVTTNGATFYSMKMYGGGTVFMSSDTEMEPVLAFTDSADDFSEIDPGSPLWALLNRDVSERRAALDAVPLVMLRASAGASAAAQSSEMSDTSAKWASLVASGEDLQSASSFLSLLTASSAPRTAAPGDLRVDPFLVSTWDQSGAKNGSLACYNYYTPKDDTGVIDEGNPANAVCGCVATAMAQVMFYHKYPAKATVPETPEICWFNKTKLSGSKALAVSGDEYDWDSMVASPTVYESLAARKAIGLLTSDAGRAVGMRYSDGESGAFLVKAAKALGDVFGFGQSVSVDANPSGSSVGSITASSTIGRLLLSNLDAGYPVLLGISGPSGGHAICADGYGYQGETQYVHLNMGWSGNYNIWYNLPTISAGKHSYNVVDDAVYNIMPHGGGLGVMSGRVVDEDGCGLAGVGVSVYDAGSNALVTQLVTSVYGVWGAPLAPGTYRVVAEDATTKLTGELKSVSLAKPAPQLVPRQWKDPDGTVGKGDFQIVTKKADLGNSWGNDMTLVRPCARIVDGIATNVYNSLDAAIVGARGIATAKPGVAPVMEILRDIELAANATIDFKCVLRAATGAESSTLVNRPSGAVLAVAAGAELYVSNCVFEAAGGAFPISVAAGGKVFVGPGFSGGVSTVDASGFNVVGHVTADIAVDCASAGTAGQIFGAATSDDASALSNSVARIYATFDSYRETRGTAQEVSPGVFNLVWEGVSLPPEASAGYYVTAAGKTNAFGRVDKLFENFEVSKAAGLLGSAPEIVVVGNDDNGLSRDFIVSSPCVLRGVAGAKIKPTTDAHIIVENGGSLVVKDLVIGDRTYDTFVHVRSGGSMTLDSGAVLTNLVCSGNKSESPGPISVEGDGALKLNVGSAIIGCKATATKYGKQGGGVYVAKGGVLDLAGGHIRNCSTVNGQGGGVYAILGANVIVSGPSVVSGNVSGKEGSTVNNDIYFNSPSDFVTVTNSAVGGFIGIKYVGSYSTTNFVFAHAASAAIAVAATNAPALFFNDVDASYAVGVTNSTELMWYVPEPPLPPPEDLVALLEIDGGATITNGSLQAAFERVPGVATAATITLYSNCTFSADLVVPRGCNIRMISTKQICVARDGDYSIIIGDDAALSVSNVVFTDSGIVVANNPLFSVGGGSLEFLAGTKVSGLSLYGRAAAAVTVMDGAASGGTFTMHDGAEISCCTNFYVHGPDSTAYAAGLLVNGMSLQCVARLDGGVITNCVAYRTGGVYVGNKGKIFLSGDIEISGNSSTKGADANLSVAADSGLVLEGGLTGSVGVRRDAKADRVIFGCVDGDFVGEASKSNVVASAMNFSSDDGYGYGIAVTGEDGVVSLAWSENIVDDGKYAPVSDSSVPFPVAPPVAAVGLAYTGEALTGVVSRVGYVLSGTSVATNAGEYVSIATLSPGYVWSDASSGEKTNNWSIARGTFDMNGVVFEDATERYDGNPKTLKVSGMLPEGVTVTYSPGTGVVNAGRYVFTAKFKVADPANYNAVPDKTATLTIVNVITKPTAQTGLVYNAAAQSGVVADPKYVLSGDVSGVNAGIDYATVVSPAEFCVWPDMTTNGVKVAWQIAPAPLTIFASNAWKRVGMSDPLPFKYDVGGLQGTDAAEDVLSGSLDRAAGESKGQYAITQGTLAVRPDVPNYVIDNFTMAFLSIIGENDDPPGPGGAEPLPIAFTAIAGQDGKWTLTVTTTVAKCWYSLYETNSLAGGFLIDDVAPVTNRQADASVMTFERPSGGQQLFWRIRAEPENAH